MSRLFAGTPWERPVTCEACGKPLADCACPRDASGRRCPPSAQNVRVSREKRGGKVVTLIRGLDRVANDVPALLKTLRKELATGGTCDGGAIELQGDHRDRLVERFRAQGYPAKAAGG